MFEIKNQQAKFLAIAAVFIIIGILAFSNSGFLEIAHGTTLFLIGGNSNGKLIITLLFFAVFSLACLAFSLTKIPEKIEKKQELFFKLFVIFAGLLFIAGIIQFQSFAGKFENGFHFATLLKEDNYINWEASRISHNHFTKIALSYISKTLGLKISGEFDDGLPFYNVFPNPELWSILLLSLGFLAVFFGIAHAVSRSKRIKLPDFLLFSAGVLFVIIYGFDGGILEDSFAFGIFFLTAYFLRNYTSQKNSWKNILPLALSLAVVSFIEIASQEGLTNQTNLSLLLTLGLGYFIVMEILEKTVRKNLAVNAFIAVIFLASLANTAGFFQNFSEGREVIDFSKDSFWKAKIEGNALFIYGLPKDSSNESILKELERFGKVEEFDRIEWTAFARIIPYSPFRSLKLKTALVESLKPKGYLYVEDNFPEENVFYFKIFLLENKTPVKFRESFLGMKVLKQEFDSGSNAISVSIKSPYKEKLVMLGVLEEASFQGLEKQVLVSRE